MQLIHSGQRKKSPKKSPQDSLEMRLIPSGRRGEKQSSMQDPLEMHRKQTEQIGNAQRTRGQVENAKKTKEKTREVCRTHQKWGEKTKKQPNPPRPLEIGGKPNKQTNPQDPSQHRNITPPAENHAAKISRTAFKKYKAEPYLSRQPPRIAHSLTAGAKELQRSSLVAT